MVKGCDRGTREPSHNRIQKKSLQRNILYKMNRWKKKKSILSLKNILARLNLGNVSKNLKKLVEVFSI